MNWEAIGAIGDFVSGVAVLVTLAYLLVQARQTNEQLRLSTEALRVSAIERNQEAGQRSRELLITNPDAADLFVRGVQDLASVEKSDRFRFDLLIRNIVYAIQAAYGRFVVGGVDSSEFDEMIPVIDTLFSGAGAREWWQKRKHEFNPEFRSFVDDRIQ